MISLKKNLVFLKT